MDSGPNIRALLHRRRDELLKLQARVRAHLLQINEELESLQKAAGAINLDFEKREEETAKSARTPAPLPGMSIKEAALALLEKHPGGLTANEIRGLMREMFGMNYERSSLSPQLSRLKFDGIITRRDGRWLLPKFLEQNSKELFGDNVHEGTVAEAQMEAAKENEPNRPI